MSNGHRWSKFWWQDWQGDKALRMVSLAARGLWIELLCIAHEAEPYGHVLVNKKPAVPKMIASILGNTTEREVVKLLAELEDAGVFSRTEDGTIYCRRMIRDKAASEAGRETGKMGGNPALNGSGKPPKNTAGGLTPPINHDLNGTPYTLEAESESEERKEVSAGLCPAPRADAGAPTRDPPRLVAKSEDDEAAALLAVIPNVGVRSDRGRASLLGKFRQAAGDDREQVVIALHRAVEVRPADPVAFVFGCLRPSRKLSKWDQIHAELGTTSLLAPVFDPDPDEPPNRRRLVS